MRIGDLQDFRSSLEARGWAVEPLQPDAPEHGPFCAGLWRLRSVWSPAGLAAELRFHGDGPHAGAGPRGLGTDWREAAWKIWLVALHAPGAAQPALELRVGTRGIDWPEQARAVSEALDRLRDAAGV